MAGAGVKEWGTCAHDGKEVKLFTIRAPSGAYATVTNYGATLTSLWVPDRNGTLGDVLLGYDSFSGYEAHVVSFGQTVGRFANRIAQGKFSLDGEEHVLVQNNGTNCLHGGIWSFNNKTWEVVTSTESSVTLRYESAHLEENFPGTVVVTVEFFFGSGTGDETSSSLHIRYSAETDRATVVNLTNHAYFNLAGHSGNAEHPSVLDHIVTISADTMLPVNSDCIPLGEAASVEGTFFDFRAPTRIGENIDKETEQLKHCNGFDHCFCLTNGEPKPTPEGTPQGMRALGVTTGADGVDERIRGPDALLVDPSSGRFMETYTEEPGVHFFTNNIPNDVLGLGGKGKQGAEYTFRTGVCFETQHYPDSPNQAQFPSTVLRPGSPYTSETVYWFGVQK